MESLSSSLCFAGVLLFVLVLAAAFGAGRDLPIAGGGISATRGKQIAVTALMASGSVVGLIATASLLVGWQWQA